MRVLVSGSRGFVGSALVTRLLAGGHDVVRAVHGAPCEGEVGLDLKARRLDTSRLSKDGLDGLDAVVHLAGEPIVPLRWSPARRQAIRSSRVVSTDLVARTLARLAHPPEVLVSASAIGFYGDRGDELLDEDAPAGTGYLPELCRAWEAASVPARKAGIRVVNARTGIVLGPGGGALSPQIRAFRVGLGARLGSGRQWMSWIALDDTVGALLHAITTSRLSGAVNVTAPDPVRNDAFTEALANALGRRARLRVPKAVLRVPMGRLVRDEIVLQSARVLPRRLLATEYTFTMPVLDDALAAAIATGDGV